MDKAKLHFAIREAAKIDDGSLSLLDARIDRKIENCQIAAHFGAVIVVPVWLIMRGRDRS
jgi:hypothetical protein